MSISKYKMNASEPSETGSESSAPSVRETESGNRLPIRCHCLVCLKHWFFRYYSLVVALLLVGGLCVTISSETAGHWRALGGFIAAVLSLIYFIQKQKLEELKLFKEIFTIFNESYDGLSEKLNRIREDRKSTRLNSSHANISY